MQIPEMFSYDGMKNIKYWMKRFLFLPKNTKWKKELKLNTILLLKLCMNILYLFASFPVCIYLYFYFQYLSTFEI